jgi:hypothetical protein
MYPVLAKSFHLLCLAMLETRQIAGKDETSSLLAKATPDAAARMSFRIPPSMTTQAAGHTWAPEFGAVSAG